MKSETKSNPKYNSYNHCINIPLWHIAIISWSKNLNIYDDQNQE